MEPIDYKNLQDQEVLLTKQPDGNWIGWMNKGGKLHTVRQGDPATVLQLLITQP